MQCDIIEFYPSIKELLKRALEFAQKKNTLKLTDKEEEIIYHARDTVLFNKGEPWKKKKSLFDVRMKAYDDAEVAELA